MPAHPIGIWLGTYGPRALALTGRIADGWVVSFRGDLAALGDLVARIDDAAQQAGRNPAELRRILNFGGAITAGPSRGPLTGPVDQWVSELTEFAVRHGFDTFILWGEGEDQRSKFAYEVTPAVRSAVETERRR